MKKTLAFAFALLVGGLVMSTGGMAWACSCVESGPAQHVKRADVIFVGTAIGVERSQDRVRGTFAVDSVYKGAGAATVLVDTGVQPANCFTFVPGARYVVFAQGDLTAGLRAPSCSGTTDDLAVLGRPGLRPDDVRERYDPSALDGPLAQDGPGLAPPRGPRAGMLVAAGILAIAAGAGTVVAGRRFRSTASTR